MMMPRIFGENLFDDFMNDFAFPDFTDSANIEKALYVPRNLGGTAVMYLQPSHGTLRGAAFCVPLQIGRAHV